MRVRELFAIGVVAFTTAGALGVSYDEGVDGDLSGNRVAPTSLGTLGIGSHTLSGNTASGDLDYWTIDIPAGAQLSQIILTSFVSTDDIAFIAIQSGAVFTEPASGTVVGNLLGYTHFGPGPGAAPPGTDFLDNLGVGPGSIGFTPPLPSNDYTFWTQQVNPQGVAYTFTIVVTSSVPPAAYDEGVDGDISGNRLAPTDVGSLAVGTHSVIGHTVSGDLDYWTINIPSGAQLSQVNLANWVSLDDIAFIAIQSGTTFTEPATGTVVGNLLGYTHFGPGGAAPGTDVLDNMGLGFGSIGFTPPLPAGDYTFWTQQTSPEGVDYTFDLVVTVAPPPPSCDGDVNGDGFTNISDFNILAGNFGATVTPNTGGDLTGEGLVNISDFNILAGDFGCAP